MKITLWGINYAPEVIGIAPFNQDLGEFLAGRGHEVTAVTTFPYYPHWRKEPGDRGWSRRDTIAGVTVYRCWCYVPAVATPLRRIVHELTFGMTSLLRVLAQPRSDVYLVVSPPLALGFFAWIATRLKRSRFVFHVQDLQPDAAVGLGMLRPGAMVRFLYALERSAYVKAAVVSGISSGMMAAFRQKGISAAKCVLLPNWLQSARIEPTDRSTARRRFDIAENALLAIYSGNLGRKQNLEILIAAAARLSRLAPSDTGKVRLIIAGDGAARPGLEQSLREHPGADVQLLPLLSNADYAALLAAADVALITQAAGTGQFFLPSKLLSVLAVGLPVVAVADTNSELTRAVRDGGFGCVVAPADADGLATVLQQLAASRAQLAKWASRTGWVGQFSRDTILPRFEAVLELAGSGKAPNFDASLEPTTPSNTPPAVPDAPVGDSLMPRRWRGSDGQTKLPS